jgi:hypothetical protein
VPLACNVRFGKPLLRGKEESEEDFVARARDAVIALARENPGRGVMFKPSESQEVRTERPADGAA